MIIDAHAHLFHRRWYPEAAWRCMAEDSMRPRPGAPPPGDRFATTLARMLTDEDGSRTIAAMDGAGIDRRLVLVLDWGVELGEPPCSIRDAHREILGICARFKERLFGFAGLDPRRLDAVEILTWAIDELGARGLKLHPTSPGWRLTDDRTHRLVEVAAARRLAVVAHVGPTLRVLSDEHATFDDLIRLAAAYPSLPFVAGHAGGSLWRGLLRRPDVPANLYFDVSGWQGRSSDPEGLASDLRALMDAFPGRVLFGTDSPFHTQGRITEKSWVETLRARCVEAGRDLEAFFANPMLQVITKP